MWREWWRRFQAWLHPAKPIPCPPHVWRWAERTETTVPGYWCEKCHTWADARVAFTSWKKMWGAK